MPFFAGNGPINREKAKFESHLKFWDPLQSLFLASKSALSNLENMLKHSEKAKTNKPSKFNVIDDKNG